MQHVLLKMAGHAPKTYQYYQYAHLFEETTSGFKGKYEMMEITRIIQAALVIDLVKLMDGIVAVEIIPKRIHAQLYETMDLLQEQNNEKTAILMT